MDGFAGRVAVGRDAFREGRRSKRGGGVLHRRLIVVGRPLEHRAQLGGLLPHPDHPDDHLGKEPRPLGGDGKRVSPADRLAHLLVGFPKMNVFRGLDLDLEGLVEGNAVFKKVPRVRHVCATTPFKSRVLKSGALSGRNTHGKKRPHSGRT